MNLFATLFLLVFRPGGFTPMVTCTGTPEPLSAQDSLPYDLHRPIFIINLEHKDLNEISGLSPSGEPGILCAISDEKGEVLFMDARSGAIKRRVLFRDKGDFEGVEKVNDHLYAIKSDGDLYKISHWKRKKPKYKKYRTGLSRTDDVEGLGYDPLRNALLIACKGDPDSAHIRPVFAFDLRTKRLGAQPVFKIDPLEVNRLVPYDEQDKHNFFSASGVAIHPLTGDVYVVSTSLKRLVALDYQSGKIKMAARLDKAMCPQPEGIAFDPAGDLFISSEGKKSNGMLFRFEYHKP